MRYGLPQLNGKTGAMGSAVCGVGQRREIFPVTLGKPSVSGRYWAGYRCGLVVQPAISLHNLAFPMLRTRFTACALAFIGLILDPGFVYADSGVPAARAIGLAIVDFSYVDTSGEPADQTATHEKRRQALMTALRRDVAVDGQFHIVRISCGSALCTTDGMAPGDLLRAASDAGAQILVIGGIHKQSTLVQWMKVKAIDIATNRVALDKLFTFRGDSDEAWGRAAAFVSQEIRTKLATQ